ncbi:MAG: LCP family protein, partial [Actinobacteria bacterium]|nr:LCP family protein [Actinomycetota bacterium]
MSMQENEMQKYPKKYKKNVENKNVENNKNSKGNTHKIKPWVKRLLFILVPLIVVAGGGGAWFFFSSLRSINHTINSGTTPEIKETLTPVESPKEPVSVLILGIDTRDNESDRGRADTIMLLYLDPGRNRGSLLSIPRDTLVEIPGHGKDKINAAYAYGGEELMIETVSQFLDADINHYITVDFQGFVELIDALGGVDIVIDRPLIDPKSGANFSAGKHHLTGEQALSYTRSRSTELGDIGRIQRQQHLFRELVNQKLNTKYLSGLPQYINIVVQNTRTDLNVLDILKYSKVALSFSSENFETAIIPSHPDWIENGTISVQIPDIDEARDMWKRIVRGEPASKYNALYFELEGFPDSAAVNTYYNVKLKAKNTGAITWRKSGDNPFFAGYHWIDFENKKMVVFDGDRAFLSKEEVKPGEEVEFEL